MRRVHARCIRVIPFFDNWFCSFEYAHSEIAPDGHSSTHAPQSTHFPASITATSSTVIAPWGQASAHAPHATHSLAFTVGIFNTSNQRPIKSYLTFSRGMRRRIPHTYVSDDIWLRNTEKSDGDSEIHQDRACRTYLGAFAASLASAAVDDYTVGHGDRPLGAFAHAGTAPVTVAIVDYRHRTRNRLEPIYPDCRIPLRWKSCRERFGTVTRSRRDTS